MTLDPGEDPDRYDPTKSVTSAGPLDPSADPDRFHSPTLPGLLGEGAQEEHRDNVAWLVGLVSVFGFLLLCSLLLRLAG